MTARRHTTLASTAGACGLTLIEVLIALCLIGAVASLAVGAATPHTVSRARRAVQGENLHKVESALELYYAQHGRYPDALEALVASPGEPPSSSGDTRLALLAELPANPLGRWGYDGMGRVWPIDDRPARTAGDTNGAAIPRGTTYHVSSAIVLAVAFIGSVSAGVLASAWHAVWTACLQTLAFRGGGWDHLARSAWLGLSKDLIHSEGELRSLVSYSSSLSLSRGAALDGLTGRLRDYMRRQATAGQIPIRGAQWEAALANFGRISPKDQSQRGGVAGRHRPLGWMLAPGVLLVIVGGILSIVGSRASAAPPQGSAATPLLLAASLLLALRLLLGLGRAEHRAHS